MSGIRRPAQRARILNSMCMSRANGTPGPTDRARQVWAMPFDTVDIMIRDRGVETLRGYHREAVFEAVATKANWPAAAGVRFGPEEELLVAGGRVRAELHLLGLRLSVAGVVTGFEPGGCIEATGSQSGISATMVVRFADNADDPNRNYPVETTVTWQFEAGLPKRRAVLEIPAAAAIKAAIPLLRARFISNIIQYLDGRRPVEDGPSVAGTPDDRVLRLVNEGELTRDDPID